MTPQFVARAQAFGKAVAQVQLLDMLDPKHRHPLNAGVLT
jgi:hypothetical protein